MNKKSKKILLILFFLLIFLCSSSYFIIYLSRTMNRDAQTINDIGIIRGSIQRLTKLEIAEIQRDEIIDLIDQKIEEYGWGSGINEEKDGGVVKRINGFYYEWIDFKKILFNFRNNPNYMNKEELIIKSEAMWKEADNIVYITQVLSEKKLEYSKISFPFLMINIFLIIAIIILIKTYVSDELEVLVHYDPLTKIYNRNFYYEYMICEIERTKRYNHPLSLMMLDIDHFKAINDTYGHDIGDKVLYQLAQLIQKNIRNNDIFARIGGEEFIIILPETASEQGVFVAEKIRNLIEKFSFEKVEHITISIGITELVKQDNIDTIYKRVDTALYKAKKNGRNQVQKEAK